MLFAISNSKNLLVEGALFNLGIEIQCVSEYVWVGGGGLRGRGGELPAEGIHASQGTFSSIMLTPSTDTPVQNLLIKYMLQNVKKSVLSVDTLSFILKKGLRNVGYVLYVLLLALCILV